jgi:hypothetical protein
MKNSKRLSQILKEGDKKSINSIDIEINEQYNLENNFEESSCNDDQEFLDLDKVDFDITPVV